jgi:hypothetical protein
MLWVVAAFGRTLSPDHEESARTLHARRVQQRVEDLAPRLHTLDGIAAYDTLTRLSADIMDALEWSLETDPNRACRIAADMTWHWHTRGNWLDRLAFLERLRSVTRSVSGTTRLRTQITEMILRFDTRDITAALDLALEISNEARTLRSSAAIAAAEAMIAAVNSMTGEREKGISASERAQRAADDTADPFARSVAWFSEASIHLNTATHERGIELCRQIVDAGDPDPLMWASAAFVVSRSERINGNLETAEDLIVRSTDILDLLMEPTFRPFSYIELAMLHRILGRYPSASHHLISTLDDAVRRNDSIVMTPSMDAMALLARDLGDEGTAVAMATAAERKRETAPWTVNPWDLPEAATLLTDLDASMAADEYERHARKGASLADSDVLELARATVGAI